ncbi:hypothetical protein AB0M39_38035 [Streptomyces sp. NPDC051907]|uniref:hypothetical protein n=1 Tax=Streptomyces sp. NPDC051907 TaxID=3155284 RepID=UPI00343419BA
MYLILPSHTPDPELDPVIMRRRTLIAAALGLPGAALPAWAASAAETPDSDATLLKASFGEAYGAALHELETLGARYVTHAGALDRHTIMDTGLWVFAQANLLAAKSELKHKRHAKRLAAEAAMFAAGCYIDFGNEHAATELYSRAHTLCGDGDRDLRAFIHAQANWVPMYSGQWRTVLRRSERIIADAEQHGGFGLLMGWMHLAHAQAILGDKAGALDSLTRAQANISRVPGARSPQTALGYSATKVWFSSSTVYAELGDAARQGDAQHRALEDPTLGWIDRNLMRLGQAQLDPDPEYAARRIRMHVLGLPRDSFNHCIKAQAMRITGKLKAKQITRPQHAAGKEVIALGQYLNTVEVA